MINFQRRRNLTINLFHQSNRFFDNQKKNEIQNIFRINENSVDDDDDDECPQGKKNKIKILTDDDHHHH